MPAAHRAGHQFIAPLVCGNECAKNMAPITSFHSTMLMNMGVSLVSADLST